MGAPSVNLKQIIGKLTKNVDKVALRQSALFYLPSLATTIVTFLLFSILRDFNPGELNKLQVIIMASVILSLVIVAGMQILINRVVGDARGPEAQITQKAHAIGFIRLAAILSGIVSIAIAAILYPFFIGVIHLTNLEFFYFVILFIVYSQIWILTAAFWAWGLYKYPAIIYILCYLIMFVLSYIGYRLSPVNFMIGYIGGLALLLALLSIFSLSVFRIEQKPQGLWKVLQTLPKLITKEYWGILFQTFFILAIFLDKIIVWISEGIKAGNGFQIVGTYTTGAFLGLIPAFCLVVLAYFTEKVRPLSKKMYTGTLNQIRNQIGEYKRLYKIGLVTMLCVGFILLVIVVGLSQIIIGDPKVTAIALTIATGVLFFEVILFNAFILPIFHRSHISAIAMLVICLGEAGTSVLVPKDVWFASLGFLGGSIIGFLISYITTRKLLSEFDYNAFHAFQMDN